MNKIDFKHKFETETGQGIYSGEGQIENAPLASVKILLL